VDVVSKPYNVQYIVDPMRFAQTLWPQHYFYSKQREIWYSVAENKITIVPSANKMGKDFVAAAIAIWFYLTHRVCRVVTTTIRDDNLDILWGEIWRFIDESQHKLRSENGGPLVCFDKDIRKIIKGNECKINYLKGMVSKSGEGMTGHHAPDTLMVIDEASGVHDQVFDHGRTCMNKFLIFGNPNPTNNFFKTLVDGGDQLAHYGMPA
jgi:hypothetical protein